MLLDHTRLGIEPMEEVDKIKTSGRLNTDNLKAYLQFVLENWPETFPEPNPDT